MMWASSLSETRESASALGEAASAVAERLDGAEPDLVVAFVSPHHADAFDALPAGLAAAFPRATIIGCSAQGVIGAGREVEERPAVSLTAAVLPGVRVRAFACDGAPPPGDVRALRQLVGAPAGEDPQLVVLCDPYSIDAEVLVAGLDRAYPTARKVGGLASGGLLRGANLLIAGGHAHRAGAVGVALSGDIAVDTIVAQGCRPIGVPMPITRADGNVIRELNKKRPTDVLRALHDSLPPDDQALFRNSLFIGLEMNEAELEHSSSELLVRNLIGVDRSSGALAVAATVRPWQVVQFLLRDARTAEEDLIARLDRQRAEGRPPEGVLLFSCLGRGMHLFGRPDHDTDLFRERVGAVPLGGFFCNGEIGPVGGQTFLHGYTSAFGLFRQK